MLEQAIHNAIKEVLIDFGVPEARYILERPGEFAHGDYATNAALAAAKELKRNPREVAESLREKLLEKKSSELFAVEKIEIAGPGFVNFFLTRETLTQEIERAANNMQWGKNELYANKTVMVEYTQPNPFKPFHIGHLMSNTIGESIARLLAVSGAEVIRANYQGDVGPHVAKALHILLESAVAQPTIAQIGEAYVEGNKRYEENAEDKVKIDELNRKIYARSDEKINALYDYGRQLSLDHFEEIYKTLGTKFDHYFFESESGPKGADIVKKHSNIFEHSDGALIFRGEPYGLHTRVFVTSQGLPTYEAKEVGLAELKQEATAFDLSITVTAVEQKGFFEVVFKALSLLYPVLVDKMLHISHGMMRFASGKMSSRKGNVITGESLLRDLTEEARAKMDARPIEHADTIAEQVAVGAIKYAVLRQGSGKDIVFDPEKSLSLEGDSGPYLQYAHTRARSLIEEAVKQNVPPNLTDAPTDALPLERLIIHYPEVVLRAAQELEPHHVTTYLTELASEFNSWYASVRVIGGPYPSYGLLLTQAVEKTLAKGLEVLGIPAPEEM